MDVSASSIKTLIAVSFNSILVGILVSIVYRFELEQPVNKLKNINRKSKKDKLRNFKTDN